MMDMHLQLGHAVALQLAPDLLGGARHEVLQGAGLTAASCISAASRLRHRRAAAVGAVQAAGPPAAAAAACTKM
jgi:hypothetical protein